MDPEEKKRQERALREMGEASGRPFAWPAAVNAQASNTFSPRAQRDMAALQAQHAQAAHASRMQEAALLAGRPADVFRPPSPQDEALRMELALQEDQDRYENRARQKRALPPKSKAPAKVDPTKASNLPSTSKGATMNERQRAIYKKKKALPKQKKA